MQLVGEPFGRLGKDVARFVSDLGDVSASDGCALLSAIVRTAWRELTRALCPGYARTDDRSLVALARGVGRGFMSGSERAVNEI